MSTFANANKFVLRSRDLIVTYGEAGLDGTPYLSYAKTGVSLAFKGDQIRILQKTDVGKVVSVSTHITVDSGSASFTILIPKSMLAKGQVSIPIKTVGITTIHRSSVLPVLNGGQRDLYVTTFLSGTASIESHP
jgi:hypothetical protein